MHDIDLLRQDTPWAIVPSALEQHVRALNGMPLSSIARFDETAAAAHVQASLTQRGMEALQGAHFSARVGDVAVIPIRGTVMPRAPQWWWSYAAVLSGIAHDVRIALDDTSIAALVLDVDSPGGRVTGTEEFSDLLFDLRGTKPIVAHCAGGMVASAALWIASAADQIVIDRTAEVGSVGVVASFVDWSQFDEKLGIREIEIVSAQSPKKRMPPTTKEGRALIQTRVNELADVFISHLARNRGVSEDDVLQNFGQGDLLVGESAIANGLADRIATFETLVSELSAGRTRSIFMTGKASPTIKASDITREFLAEHCAELLGAITTEAAAAATATATADAQQTSEAAIAAARTEGATAERARIHGIEQAAVPGIETWIAEAKYDPDMTVEKASVEGLRRIRAGEVDHTALSLAGGEAPLGPDAVAPASDGAHATGVVTRLPNANEVFRARAAARDKRNARN